MVVLILYFLGFVEGIEGVGCDVWTIRDDV